MLRELVELAGLEPSETPSTPGSRGGAGTPGTPLGEAERAMLDYALKLTRLPAQVRSEDVEALRRAGFDDRAIHDVCAIAAYFAFVNRIADGLGVELEESTASDTR